MSAAPGERSASFIILKAVIAFLVFGLLITMLIEPWSTIVGTSLFTFETQWGQDLGTWLTGLQKWIGLLSLVSIFFYGWIRSRRASR